MQHIGGAQFQKRGAVPFTVHKHLHRVDAFPESLVALRLHKQRECHE